MLYVFCVECRDKKLINKRYNAYSVVATHGKRPRVDFAFACQPWAIKSTTLTALRNSYIRNGEYIHINVNITSSILYDNKIHHDRQNPLKFIMITLILQIKNIRNIGYIH